MATIEERLKAIEEKLGIEQKPVAGWYKTHDEDNEKWLFYISDGVRRYGIDSDGDWKNLPTQYVLEDSDYLADPKEVEQRLIEEAKRRGFKEGVLVVDVDDGDEDRIGRDSYIYYPKDIRQRFECLTLDYTHIFKDGIWAEIIEPLTLNGKEVKYNNVSKRLIFENGESLPIMRIHYLSKDESLKNIIGEDLQQDLKQLLTKIEERENK